MRYYLLGYILGIFTGVILARGWIFYDKLKADMLLLF